ncbi:MAG: LysR substrate-binding domain-containing protein [Duganella sp.]
MIKIEDLRLMATLARCVSLSEAARVLNVTPSVRENDEDVTLWHYRTDQGGVEARWGARESIRIHPALQSNDGGTARYWAEQGLGLVLRSQWDVEEVVRQGRLVRVLQPWRFDAAPILILVPSSKNLPSRVRTAFDFFVEALRAE